MYKSSFYVLSAILSTSTALASSLNCNKFPPCEELGFTNVEAEWKDCTKTLACLFDPSYKICLEQPEPEPEPFTCPEGTMLAADCRSEHNGVLQRTSIDANGCGICLSCGDGDLHLAGEITSLDQIPYTHGYKLLNSSDDDNISAADICLKPCRCPAGFELADPSKVIKSGGGQYCLSRSTSVGGSGSYTFDSAITSSGYEGCTGSLIIDYGAKLDTVTSWVKTTIRSSSSVKELNLNNDSIFEGAMACGTCTSSSCGSTPECRIKLSSFAVHDFSKGVLGSSTNNKPAVVTCTSVKYIEMGSTSPNNSGFLFSGSHKGLNGGNCKGQKCMLSGKEKYFTNSNTCE